MVTYTTPQTDNGDDNDTDEHAVTCYELDSKSLLLLVGAPHQQLFECFGRHVKEDVPSPPHRGSRPW